MRSKSKNVPLTLAFSPASGGEGIKDKITHLKANRDKLQVSFEFLVLGKNRGLICHTTNQLVIIK
ncbi:MAG: hypothetical protein DRG58_05415 [Deltaproteobacteria bacterium]|nr:MAG: hypothetical protein DRG58_05415 [Deltaproteobacteria bacterium]